MTKREREMLIQSVSWNDKSLTVNEEKAFQAGAKWAGKTMIYRACKWLKENIEGGVHPQSVYGFVDKFRKAMEE